MAIITQLEARLAFPQLPSKSGTYYSCCIFANLEFIERYKNALSAGKENLTPGTREYNVISSMFQEMKNYTRLKDEMERKRAEESETWLPEGFYIPDHFALLPDKDGRIELAFRPLNNVPTDALLYTHDEFTAIRNALKLSLEKANQTQTGYIKPVFERFDSFLNDWDAYYEKNGSYFAPQQTI